MQFPANCKYTADHEWIRIESGNVAVVLARTGEPRAKSNITAFIVEHDFIMATYLADRVVVYTGQPGIEATATTPQSLLSGMNQFLKSLQVTFRRDPVNYRPRYVW